MPQLFAALSTEFVLALTAGAEECAEAMDLLGQLGYSFMITPVVEESLYWIQRNACESARVIEASQTAHSQLAALGILTPSLSNLDRLFTRNTAEKWNAEGLFPGAHMNDFLAITEASRLEARILITGRPIGKMDAKVLNERLLEAQLNPLRLIWMDNLLD